MHNTAGGFLLRHVHNSIKSSALLRREVEPPGAADRDSKWRINSAAQITWSCLQHPTPSSALITTNHLDIFNGVFYVYGFHWGDICFPFFFFFFLCLSRVRSFINPHFSWIPSDFIIGGQADKVNWNPGASHSDIDVHSCTSSEAEQINCWHWL